MLRSTRNYFRRLAEGYEDGFFAKALHPILGVAETSYAQAVGALRWSYERGFLKRRKLPFPVVSVGNLTWGGTGKTPFVEYLARKVADRRKTPLILTRGYGGDESRQFQHHLPKAVIGVGKDRCRVAEEMSKSHQIDMAILDDGLQHWLLERDLDMVTVNALNPFGNGHLVPRGILREPVAILKRADVLVISHANLVPSEELIKLKAKLRDLAPKASMAEAFFEPLFFYRAKKKGRIPLAKLAGQRVTTFSGLGAPRSFQLMLSRLQIRPIRNFEFGDHHLFTQQELGEIKNVSDSALAADIITTEKDFFRAPELITQTLDPLILATKLRIASGEDAIMERISRLLGVSLHDARA